MLGKVSMGYLDLIILVDVNLLFTPVISFPIQQGRVFFSL